MPGNLSIGIVLPSNIKGGPQKVTAIAAVDLARSGHRVSIFVPVLPYYYYSVSLGQGYWFWLRHRLPPYVKDWLHNRKFTFQDLLNEEDVFGRVSVQFVARCASRRQVAACDYLIVHTIAQVAEYQHLFPQERQIYLLQHPEEHVHRHADIFKALRKSFKGEILVSSPFTAREVIDHVSNPPVVPNPISPIFWAQGRAYDFGASRQDMLFFYGAYKGGREGMEIVKALLAVRPRTTLTVWARDSVAELRQALSNVTIVQNVSEKHLCDLYLGHSFLLFPSTYEGFGMPPIEALACGCIPVLHSEVGAAELYARNGENSIYMNGNVMDLAGRIASILDSPQILRAMRVAAPESVQPFDPNGYGQRLLRAAGIL